MKCPSCQTGKEKKRLMLLSPGCYPKKIKLIAEGEDA